MSQRFKIFFPSLILGHMLDASMIQFLRTGNRNFAVVKAMIKMAVDKKQLRQKPTSLRCGSLISSFLNDELNFTMLGGKSSCTEISF